MNHWVRPLVRLLVRNREYLVNNMKIYLTEYVDPSLTSYIYKTSGHRSCFTIYKMFVFKYV